MSARPCCALEFPFFCCDLPSTRTPKESCAVHWGFHIWKHFMWFTLKSINPKIARFIFFLCIAAWFNSSLCDGPRRCVSMCYSRKRAEAEGRKGSFPCSKAMSSHHPTDPVELRRINFQTPGKPGKRGRTHTSTESTCTYMCVLQSTGCLFFSFVLFCFLRLTMVLSPFQPTVYQCTAVIAGCQVSWFQLAIDLLSAVMVSSLPQPLSFMFLSFLPPLCCCPFFLTFFPSSVLLSSSIFMLTNLPSHLGWSRLNWQHSIRMPLELLLYKETLQKTLKYIPC